MPPVILTRSASLTNFVDLAQASGQDPWRLAALVGLPARCLRDPDMRVPAMAVGRLLDLAAERSGVEAFGLRLAETRRPSNLGLLSLLLRDEPTLRALLESMARYARLQNEALILRVQEQDGWVLLREEFQGTQHATLRQATELAIGVLHRLLSPFMVGPGRGIRVCFRHGPPRDAAYHQRFFGPGAVSFQQDFNGLMFRASALDAATPGADPVLARYAHQLLDRALPGQRDSFAQDVRQLILVLLSSGQSRVDQVGRLLGVDRRTVHRRLAGEGTTFSAIEDGVREELVDRYLADAGRPLGDVATMLGFAAHSIFTRWCQGRFGESPSRRRARLAATESPPEAVHVDR